MGPNCCIIKKFFQPHTSNFFPLPPQQLLRVEGSLRAGDPSGGNVALQKPHQPQLCAADAALPGRVRPGRTGDHWVLRPQSGLSRLPERLVGLLVGLYPERGPNRCDQGGCGAAATGLFPAVLPGWPDERGHGVHRRSVDGEGWT